MFTNLMFFGVPTRRLARSPHLASPRCLAARPRLAGPPVRQLPGLPTVVGPAGSHAAMSRRFSSIHRHVASCLVVPRRASCASGCVRHIADPECASCLSLPHVFVPTREGCARGSLFTQVHISLVRLCLLLLITIQ